ncbi:MAG TPA: tyrosine-type recombinase/integrase [Xanthobacteraceae bacterium]|jgi:integrase|nr:tyrosine-type recombinase/integrase [Xanthobacteraceae bacterium]
MATARARHGGYIFQRPGSESYYVKLRSPTGRIERSLHTVDHREAEILAGPLITAHKVALLAARPRVETIWRHKLEPGREHTAPDGGKILSTDKELFHIGHNGVITRTEPNGGPAYQLVGRPLTGRSIVDAYLQADFGDGSDKRPTVPKKNGDDHLLETYLKHANIVGYYRSEALAVWALFKRLTDNKPLKDCDRDDGRKLVTHFETQQLKSATIEKKIGWLNAAVNLAIKEGKLKFNPFSSVVPKRNDKLRRSPLSDNDMKVIKRNLDKLDASEQFLLRLLASTGMRLSEAFEIDGEETERGCRYVIVGKKTEQSLRRVPLPAAVLPFLPNSIKGPLFMSSDADPADAASKKLNRFLDDCGIDDPRKVVHSLRHRAKDRLRAVECPERIQWALLGHEETSVADDYGKGFSVPQLKKWADKIGF